MHQAWHELQRELLRRTLEYAVEAVPFYKELARSREQLQLSDFPIVGRSDFSANLAAFLALDRFPDYVVISGGTTGGPAAVSFRILEEYEAAHEFFARQHRLATTPTATEFTLDIFFNTNGYTWRKPRGWPLLSIALEQRAHAELIRTMIVRGIPIDRKTTFA